MVAAIPEASVETLVDPSLRDAYETASKMMTTSPQSWAATNILADDTINALLPLAASDRRAGALMSMASMAAVAMELMLKLRYATDDQREAVFLASDALPSFDAAFDSFTSELEAKTNRSDSSN